MANRGGKFDEILAARIACGSTLAEAAAAAGCSNRTAERRATDPAFRRKVAEIRGRMLDRVTGEFTAALGCAITELRRLVTSAESEMARLGAARCLIENALKLREHSEFEARLLNLEAAASGDLRPVSPDDPDPDPEEHAA